MGSKDTETGLELGLNLANYLLNQILAILPMTVFRPCTGAWKPNGLSWVAKQSGFSKLMAFIRCSDMLHFMGFYAKTGENFRILLILLKSLHKGDFLGETRKSSADQWSKSRSHIDSRSCDSKKQHQS